MHVFVTVATGWAGSAVVKKLIGAGRKVTELATSRLHNRSEQLRSGPLSLGIEEQRASAGSIVRLTLQ